MLINLRKSAGSWVVKGFLLLLAASFAGWGVNDIFRPDPNAAVITVGERGISIGEFARVYQQHHQQASARLSRTVTSEEAQRLGLIEISTNQLVDAALLDEAARIMELHVPDSVVAGAIRLNPAFHDIHGSFDPSIYSFTLRNAGLTTDAYEEQKRVEITRQHILSSIASGVGVPRSVIDTFYRHRFERRIAEVTIVPLVPRDEIEKPDPAQLAAYYADNIDDFYAPEYREVTFITVRPKDLIKEVQVSETELREEFDDRTAELYQPETRELQQMVFPQSDIAASALERLNNGSKFSVIARESSATNADSTSLGTLKRVDLPEEARDHVFALSEGEFSPVIKTRFGWHIYEVVKVFSGYEPEFEHIRAQLHEEIALRKAADSLYQIANAIDDELAGGASLSEAAARVDLAAHYIEFIDRSGRNRAGQLIDDLPDDTEFLESVFSAVKGVETPIIESNDGLTFVLVVGQIIPPAPFSLEKITEVVSEAWWLAQQELLTAKIAAEIVLMVKGGRSFNELTDAQGLRLTISKPFTRFGSADEIISRDLAELLFSHSVGEAVTVPLGKGGGIAVARVREVLSDSVDRTSNGYINIHRALEESIVDDLWRQYRAFLIDDLGVEIDEEILTASF